MQFFVHQANCFCFVNYKYNEIFLEAIASLEATNSLTQSVTDSGFFKS